jgi:VanZ like family
MTLTRMTARRFVTDVLPALLYMGGIFYGGSIPLRTPPLAVGLPVDKVLHLLAFGGLQLLLVRALRQGPQRLSLSHKNWIAVAGASTLGLLLELYQATLPYRSAELWDWVADTLGALLAAALVRRGARRFFASSADAPPATEPR